jgi:hypothetical protein
METLSFIMLLGKKLLESIFEFESSLLPKTSLDLQRINFLIKELNLKS